MEHGDLLVSVECLRQARALRSFVPSNVEKPLVTADNIELVLEL